MQLDTEFTRGLDLFDAVRHAPSDRAATATLDAIFPGAGAVIMAVGIMISTFGCNNGLILAGARAYYAMARDGLFFRSAGTLNLAKVPAWALVLQGIRYRVPDAPRPCRQPRAGRRSQTVRDGCLP